MKIRFRLTLWYAGVMFFSLLIMSFLLYREFILEPDHESGSVHNRFEQREDQEEDFKVISRIVLSCGVPALLLALCGGWWLMRQSMKPIEALTDAAARINEDNLGEQLPRSGNGDELDRLTEVFNGMLVRLKQSFTRVHEFTLHASHELKTPITVMRTQAETTLRGDVLTPEQHEFQAAQLEELLRLTRIVDSLTLLAKADAGLIPLVLVPLPIDELVRENFADAQILAQDQGIRLELGACETLTILGDQHRLRQLLLNLADNAIRYNSPGGLVTIAVCRAGDMAEFTISNTGPGISPDALPRIFDRFYRGDPAHNNEVEGSGLGLSIVRWIVLAHKGQIKVTSRPSQLTTVVVSLPLASSSARSS